MSRFHLSGVCLTILLLCLGPTSLLAEEETSRVLVFAAKSQGPDKSNPAGQIQQLDEEQLRVLQARGVPFRRLEDPHQLKLRTGVVDSRLHPATAEALPQDGRPGPVIVSFDGPVSAARFATLKTAVGARTVGVVPPYGYLVLVTAEVLPAVENLPGVVAVSPYLPQWRVSPRLHTDGGRVQARVIGFPGADLWSIEDLAQRYGKAMPAGASLGRSMVDIELPTALLSSVAELPEVMWIDIVPEGRLHNSAMRVVMQTERQHPSGNQNFYNPVYGIGVYGAGQRIAVTDSGLLANHETFLAPGKLVGQFYAGCGTPGDPESHGTVVASSLAGDTASVNGYGTANDYDGLALQSEIVMQDVVDGNNFCTPPNVPQSVLQFGFDQQARVHNNSWGHNVDEIMSQTGSYSNLSEEIDAWLYDPAHRESVVVFSGGNFGADWDWPWNYIPRSLSDEAHAKNAITVGATWNGEGRNVMYRWSSRGPTNDCAGSPPCTTGGRVKPDVVAPGVEIVAASSGGTALYGDVSPQGYKNTGTSFAAPAVSAAAALVRDYFSQNFYPTQPNDPAFTGPPSSALVKAMLVNSTVFLWDSSAYAGNQALGLPSDAYPNYDQGFGRPALDTVLEPAGYRDLKVYEDNTTTVVTGETWSEEVRFKDKWRADCNILRFTLVWTDPPANPAAAQALVNNLDLEVDYKGITYLGNHGLTGGNVADTLNNVEDVFVPLGKAIPKKVWPVVRVLGSSVMSGGTQPFALVVTYGPCFDNTPCPSAGGCYAGPGDVVPGTPPGPGCPGQDYSTGELPGDEPNPSCDPPDPSIRPIDVINPIQLGL